MGIPAHTRIILIPDGDGGTREYGITRGMVVALLALGFAVVVAVTVLMVTFADRYSERRRITELEHELDLAAETVSSAALLRAELDQMRTVQEKLLTMLGVEEDAVASDDSLAMWTRSAPTSTAESLRRAASVTASPKPQLWPVAGFVTKEFDRGNVARGVKPHLGLDIAGALDSPILAATAGEVTRTGEDKFLGNYVEIQHGLGYVTVYGHCSRVAVSRGDEVAGGQVIAYLGDTGQATAPHLHFEIWHQGEAVDPREVLAGDPPQN